MRGRTPLAALTSFDPFLTAECIEFRFVCTPPNCGMQEDPDSFDPFQTALFHRALNTLVEM
jgi:hypothetical protein